MKKLGLALLVGAAAQAQPPTLVERALASHVAYDHAVRLADEVGARMAGTPAADRGVAWTVKALGALGVPAHTEPVPLRAWARGPADRVELVAPYTHTLAALALGHSPATSAQGITAEIVEVRSTAELVELGDKVRGKIVFYGEAMKRSEGFDEYVRVGPMRFRGAVQAARLGAVGVLIRSVGTGSHRQPHTGCTFYDPEVPPIPFASIAAEDASLLHRALLGGPARVHMQLGGGVQAPVTSANVVAEVRGRERPDEIVLVGAHLDSWDVGDGAIDDGAGVGIAMQTLALAKAARPKRTVRMVLFMNEECGLDGARTYAQAHAAELGSYVVALEADAGAGGPLRWSATGDEKSRLLVEKLASRLGSLVKPTVELTDDAGADLGPLRAAGVPAVDLHQDMSDYFEWHHTAGDTADKIDPVAFGRTAAAFSAMVVELADSDERLTRTVAEGH